MLRTETLETSPGGFEFRKTAPFLFYEVVFDSTGAFRGCKDVFPIRRSFAEQNRVSLASIGRPVFAMNGSNSARVCANPCHRIRARLQTCSHVELQHDGWLSMFGQDFDGALLLDGSELQLMVVVAGLQTGDFQMLGGKIQRIRYGFPAVQPGSRPNQPASRS